MKAKKTKKTNSYKNGLKIIAVAMVIGGVAGGISGGLYEAAKAYGIGIDMAGITALFQSVLAPLQAIIFAVSVILGGNQSSENEGDLREAADSGG